MPSVPALSYSSYRTYQECPLRWKFLYIDRLPEAPRGYFTFGRVIHTVLEEFVRPSVVPSARRTGPSESQKTLDEWQPSGGAPTTPGWLSLDQLLAAYDRAWLGEGYTSAEEEARYRDLGKQLLTRFHRAVLRDRPQPVAVEEHLEATWDGIPVHGYIDRIDRTVNGGLEILDYKTSRELSPSDAEESDQLSLYQVLVENNYAEPVEGLTLYHLRSLTPLRVSPRPRETLSSLYNRLGEVSDGIRAEAFEPTPGRHCSRCDFRSLCPEFRAVPAGDEERLRAAVDRFEKLRAEERRVEEELKDAAEQLHRTAEELGVHRLAGSRSVALRQREETWQYALERVRPALEAAGLGGRLGTGRPEEVRRFVRDPGVDPELRRRVAETGARRVRWYWELEEKPNGG